MLIRSSHINLQQSLLVSLLFYAACESTLQLCDWPYKTLEECMRNAKPGDTCIAVNEHGE